MKVRRKESGTKNELNMTSMIDIVFLLLVFFVMTFKIVEMEGDFSIRMPLAGKAGATTDNTELPLKLRMRADAAGNLASMAMNDVDLGRDMDALQTTVLSLIGTPSPDSAPEEGPELEIDTDYNLRYEHVIEAITHVSGKKDGDQVIKLIEKIKFAKPRRG